MWSLSVGKGGGASGPVGYLARASGAHWPLVGSWVVWFLRVLAGAPPRGWGGSQACGAPSCLPPDG